MTLCPRSRCRSSTSALANSLKQIHWSSHRMQRTGRRYSVSSRTIFSYLFVILNSSRRLSWSSTISWPLPCSNSKFTKNAARMSSSASSMKVTQQNAKRNSVNTCSITWWHGQKTLIMLSRNSSRTCCSASMTSTTSSTSPATSRISWSSLSE